MMLSKLRPLTATQIKNKRAIHIQRFTKQIVKSQQQRTNILNNNSNNNVNQILSYPFSSLNNTRRVMPILFAPVVAFNGISIGQVEDDELQRMKEKKRRERLENLRLHVVVDGVDIGIAELPKAAQSQTPPPPSMPPLSKTKPQQPQQEHQIQNSQHHHQQQQQQEQSIPQKDNTIEPAAQPQDAPPQETEQPSLLLPHTDLAELVKSDLESSSDIALPDNIVKPPVEPETPSQDPETAMAQEKNHSHQQQQEEKSAEQTIITPSPPTYHDKLCEVYHYYNPYSLWKVFCSTTMRTVKYTVGYLGLLGIFFVAHNTYDRNSKVGNFITELWNDFWLDDLSIVFSAFLIGGVTNAAQWGLYFQEVLYHNIRPIKSLVDFFVQNFVLPVTPHSWIESKYQQIQAEKKQETIANNSI